MDVPAKLNLGMKEDLANALKIPVHNVVDYGPFTPKQLELIHPTINMSAVNVQRVMIRYSPQHQKTAREAWKRIWETDPVVRTSVVLDIDRGMLVVLQSSKFQPHDNVFDSSAQYEKAIKESPLDIGLSTRFEVFTLRINGEEKNRLSYGPYITA
ncbi:hypothetical protein DL95DRAFT_512813 [Leptodontidium sp. 2 PMI_412]|nr:hypothetical protein DL95DRAFT_512813 [Leptodontidium sp. 2 PMI_412]